MAKKDDFTRNSVIVMLLGLLPGLFFTFSIVGFGMSYYPGDFGDGRLNLYFLEHAHNFFTGKVSSFWDAFFMYPEKKVISYSDNLLGSAPIYSMFRIMGADNFFSYQLWFITVSVLNYISAFYFLRYIFKNNYAAVLGAFIFAFSLALQSQLTHAQTFPRFAIPLAFLMGAKFGQKLQPKYFFFAITAVVFEFYCAMYLGFLLMLPAGIFLILQIIKNYNKYFKEKFNRKWYFQLFISLIINLIFILPLIIPYLGRNMGPTMRHFIQISETLPTLGSHFYSQQGSLLWDFLSEIGQNSYQAWWDHQIFAGAIATLSLLAAFFLLVRDLLKSKFRIKDFSTPQLLLIAGLLTFFFYLRISKVSAYFLLYIVPGFSSMRSLTRIINIELIFFSISTALIFIKITKNRGKYLSLFFVFALLLVICDNFFFTDKSYRREVSVAKARTTELEKVFSKIPAGSVVSYEIANPSSAIILYHIDAMLVSQKYHLKIINAYTATCPAEYVNYWNFPSEESRTQWLRSNPIEEDSIYVVKDGYVVEKVSMDYLR